MLKIEKKKEEKLTEWLNWAGSFSRFLGKYI